MIGCLKRPDIQNIWHSCSHKWSIMREINYICYPNCLKCCMLISLTMKTLVSYTILVHAKFLCYILADRILQMFFLGVIESYPISTSISLVDKFVEMVCKDVPIMIVLSVFICCRGWKIVYHKLSSVASVITYEEMHPVIMK